MFRRILTWLAGHWVGPAPTTPEEAAAMKLYEEENHRLGLLDKPAKSPEDNARWKEYATEYKPVSKESLAAVMRKAAARDRSRLCKGGPLDGHWFANQDGSITGLFTLIRTDSDAPDRQCVVGYHDLMQCREGDVFGTYVAEVEAGVKIWKWTGWDEPVAITAPPPASPPPPSA